MGWIVFLLIIVGVCAWAYFKVPNFKKFINKALNMSGGGSVPTQKQLDELDKVLQQEKVRTKVLEDKANLAEQKRAKVKAIQDERQRQQQALQKIQGGLK